MIIALLFYLFAFGALLAGVLVVVKKNPVICALFLILAMLCLAVIYLLLGAEFIAAIQIIVYAGAIMVLFLFVIMLLNLDKEPRATVKGRFYKMAAALLAVILLAVVAGAFYQHFIPERGLAVAGNVGNTQAIARLLFGRYLLPFEITSVILLIAIIGAVILGKKKL
jgi:NADH-quinone oxidoreductase subunit J